MDDLAGLSDVDLLAVLIAAEAGNQSLAGRVAVACVPVERYKLQRFGATLRAVMLAPYQFSTFNNGHYKRFILQAAAQWHLADLAISGLLLSPAAGATHYCRYDLKPMPAWTQPQYSINRGQIGDHVFFMER